MAWFLEDETRGSGSAIGSSDPLHVLFGEAIERFENEMKSSRSQRKVMEWSLQSWEIEGRTTSEMTPCKADAIPDMSGQEKSLGLVSLASRRGGVTGLPK